MIGGVLFIGIDVGYEGTLDHQQAGWLVETVDRHRDHPKILYTGKPLVVNGQRAPCVFVDADRRHVWVQGGDGAIYATVDDVVRRPENGFVTAIGGDVHNYQRYQATIETPGAEPRSLNYVVCGGGGVFVSQTAWLPKINVDEAVSGTRVLCTEKQSVLFPRRYHSRLYLDAIIHQAAFRARFVVPLFLFAIAVLGGAAWMLHLPAPTFLTGLALLLTALALNISVRPIGWWTRFSAFVIAVLAAGIAVVRVNNDHRLWVATALIALIVGHVLFQLGETQFFGRNQLRRLIGKAISFTAGSLIVVAAIWIVWATSRPWPLWVTGVLVAFAALVALSPVLLIRRVAPNEAYEDAKRTIEDDPVPQAIRFGITKWLARNQRVFSVFETFTEGRAAQRTRVKGWGGHRLIPTKRYLPLYRSFLEIEYKNQAPGTWQFAFTAWAVTGEANTDTRPGSPTPQPPPPATVDRFTVTWHNSTTTG